MNKTRYDVTFRRVMEGDFAPSLELKISVWGYPESTGSAICEATKLAIQVGVHEFIECRESPLLFGVTA
jgi:hypothetical protein